ncbi:flagellin [Kiloniella sp.]|uniref:flagellin n=1 Tax=Kiloniella sp. TaxID=1938587 RepID=UPI003B0192F2
MISSPSPDDFRPLHVTAKIASGSRIQKASDDAAGLAIGTKIESDVTTLQQAATNASNGASILQAADGGLSNISDILQRMKQLSTQALSGAVTDDERAFIDAEFQELIEEIDGIATGTRFNGQSLLDGSTDFVAGTGVDFMVGSDVTDTITVEIADVDATALGVNALDVTDTTNATAASTAIDTAIATVSQTRAEVGAQISRFEFRGDSIATQTENLDAAQSSIMDADIAYEQAKLSSAEVLTEASIAALAKANQTPESLLQLIR